MPVAGIIGAIAAGAGSAISSSRGSRTQTQTTNTTPIPEGGFEGLKNLLIQFASNRVSNAGLPAGFEARGIKQFNQTSDLIGQNLSSALQSRGLVGSPVQAGSLAKLQAARAGDIGRFRANLPLTELALNREALRDALAVFSTRAVGGASTSVLDPGGSPLGTGLGGFGALIGLLTGQGAFGSQTNPFSREEFKKNITSKDTALALREVDETPVFEFEYKRAVQKALGSNGGKRRTGIILQRAPSHLATADGLKQDIPETTNILMAAVQQLSKDVKDLRRESDSKQFVQVLQMKPDGQGGFEHGRV